MVTFGWLLLLGTAALSAAVMWANQDVLLNSAGVIEFLGYQTEPSVGQIFAAGAVASALVIFSLWIILSGMRRRSRRMAAIRRSTITATAPVPVSVPVSRVPEVKSEAKDGEEVLAKR